MYRKKSTGACMAVCASLGVLLAGPIAASPLDNPAVTVPDADPFYAVPGDIAGSANGTVLDSRPITASAGPVPLDAKAWQVKYKTTDHTGEATATVVTVLVPNTPWTGPGPRPLVSFQSAEDGVGLRCAPSLALRGGGLLGGAVSDVVTSVPKLLHTGWAVAVADYQGPDSLFTNAKMTAHGVLDGIRAARSFAPAGIDPNAPMGLTGYSGGGYASLIAAMYQPTYAPELDFAGLAYGGTGSDSREVYDTANGGPFGGGVPILFVAQSRAYPQAQLESHLDDTGRRIIAESQADCIFDGTARYPGLDFGKHLSTEGADKLESLMWQNSPLTQPGLPAQPVFYYHATGDELVPYSSGMSMVDRMCANGVRVEHLAIPGSEHLVEAARGIDYAIPYLADRFAGKVAPTTC